MKEIALRKHGNKLEAVDEASVEAIGRIANGAYVKAKITVPRSMGQHRLFFALLSIVFKSQMEPVQFATSEDLRKALMIGTGHFHMFRDLQGREHPLPDSMDFASMDQVEFREFFDSAVKLILEKVLPNCPTGSLEQQVYDMLGEPGPDALRR